MQFLRYLSTSISLLSPFQHANNDQNLSRFLHRHLFHLKKCVDSLINIIKSHGDLGVSIPPMKYMFELI